VPLSATEREFARIDVHIADITATLAHEVVMLRDVGVEPQRTRTDFDRLNFAEGSKIVKYLVHRLQRNHGHDFECGQIHGFGRWVRYVAMEQTEDQLPLWSHFEAALPKENREFDGRPHDNDCNSTMIVDCASLTRVSSRPQFMGQTVVVRPTISDAFDVSRILGRLALSRVGGRPTQGCMCLSLRPDDGAILLVKSSYRRTWGLPGGFLDPDEDPVAGGLRELREETEGELDNPTLVVQWNRRTHIDHLIAGVLTNEPRPASWEISEMKWVASIDAGPQNTEIHPLTHHMLQRVPGGLEPFIRSLIDPVKLQK
jgi:ADP-ribose pyrophosphatase YjhB (NUDIX family)